MKKNNSTVLRMLAFASAAAILSSCAGSGAPDISGVWLPSDGSGVKTISTDGSCAGMYYNGTTPLDIGGPMSCALSETEAGGYYTLVVRQAPNQANLRVSFQTDDTLTLYTSSGEEIVTLTRQ